MRLLVFILFVLVFVQSCLSSSLLLRGLLSNGIRRPPAPVGHGGLILRLATAGSRNFRHQTHFIAAPVQRTTASATAMRTASSQSSVLRRWTGLQPVWAAHRYFSTKALMLAPYSRLSVDKVRSRFSKDVDLVVAHGRSKVVEGMFVEGTVAFGGVLPDIRVDRDAIAKVKEMFVRMNCKDEPEIERRIDCAEKVVRLLLPEQHPDQLAEYCKTVLAEKVRDDEHVDLSVFLSAGIGDCRMNALTLAIALELLPEVVKDVEYSNRKWGYTRSATRPSQPVGNQGEHAVVTFRYVNDKTNTKYVADAYAMQFDRVPVEGPLGVDNRNDWYLVDDTRLTGTRHNVYRQLVREGLFKTLSHRMSTQGMDRFKQQAKMLGPGEQHVWWGYMSPTLQHPTIVRPATKGEEKSEPSADDDYGIGYHYSERFNRH